jgi:hypothetical protein
MQQSGNSLRNATLGAISGLQSQIKEVLRAWLDGLRESLVNSFELQSGSMSTDARTP